MKIKSYKGAEPDGVIASERSEAITFSMMLFVCS